jgi:ribonucleotide reductase beta subunit family protein with ferritin-like domain
MPILNSTNYDKTTISNIRHSLFANKNVIKKSAVETVSKTVSHDETIHHGVNDMDIDEKDFIFIEDPDKNELVDLAITEPYMSSYRNYAHEFSNPEIEVEPILSLKSQRFTVFPIQYNSIWKNYKGQLKINWVVEEVDLSKDVAQWKLALNSNDRKFLMHVLAFFAAFDGIVNVNIKTNLIDVVTIKEAECAYGKQFEMENAHGEMYSLMLDTFVKNDKLKEKLINSIKTMPSIKKKAEWCKKWIESDKTYAHKLLAFAIVEAVFFSGSFCAIFWLKTRPGSVMPGLRKSNRFIARDEAKHVELACLLYSLLKNKLKETIVYDIMDEAINIEDEFINASLPCKLLGMNSELMTQYIKYVADRLLVQLGYSKRYNAENPFDFMNKIDTYVKGNFFEERNDGYSDAKIDNPRIFKILDDF